MDTDARWQQDSLLHYIWSHSSSLLDWRFPSPSGRTLSSPLTRRVLEPWQTFGNGGAICPKRAYSP